MAGIQTGAVALLFASIDNSTYLRHRLRDRYQDLLAEWWKLLRTAGRSGQDPIVEGDGVLIAFQRTGDAVAAAIKAQRAASAHRWPVQVLPRTRMVIDTCPAPSAAIQHVNPDLRRLAALCAIGHGGQILVSSSARSLIEYDLPERVRLRDLGAHRLRDLQHVEHLSQVLHPELHEDLPPLRSLDAFPNNLPTLLTSFVGRQREVADVKSWLLTARLVTLTGAGGCGKTRLALQVAADLLDGYPDGVWVAELAALSDPGLVPQVVASAMRVAEQPSRPVIETLVDSLSPQSALLLLDNCEHLLPTCAALADALLRDCPRLCIMATSRQALGIAGEVTFRVPSLSLPDIQRLPPPEHLAQYEAVRLFIDRAVLARQGFQVTPGNAPALVELCRRLDGIPLAIELAAARALTLTVEQITTRLDDRFRLLTGGSRVALPRHRTLWAAMDWSYALLPAQEQTLLRQLAVFAGGWSLEAAEAVCPGETLATPEILALLTELADKSLVAAETQGGMARFRFLETIRLYARDRLAESGEEQTARRRHRDWCLRLAEQAEGHLRGSGLDAWLEQLEIEHDNLRAALEWSHHEVDGAAAELRLAAALRWFWFFRGYWSEGRLWLEGALARGAAPPSVARLRALHGAATFARFQGDHERARALCEEGLAASRDLRDREGIAWFLLWLGAATLHEGDPDRAAALFEESRVACLDLGDKWLSSWVLAYLAVAVRLQGHSTRAASLYAESLALGKEVGDSRRVAFALHGLGLVALQQADDRKAAALFAEGLALVWAVKDRWTIHDCLEGLARAAAVQNQYERAARLFAAATGLREILGYQPFAVSQADHDRYVSATREGLGDSAFRAAWVNGTAMTLERAMAEALSPPEAAFPYPGAAKPPAVRKQAGLLTPREREVAALIARGQTNREIAARLVISERTADTHVQHILNKLGVNSRAQIAAWAVEHELFNTPRNE